MKIERRRKGFDSVQITLETKFEVDTLWFVLDSLDRGVCPHYSGEGQAELFRALINFLREVE